jgi:DivIVA domain-containing protein
MPLTPADIHNTAFKRPPIGKRGYDEEEVDAFLDEVEQELIRLLEENAALQDQMRQGARPAAGPVSTSLSAEYADLMAQLERMQEARSRAEQNARSVQAQLERAHNSAPAGPAASAADDDRGAGVLMMAQRTADDHMRDAHHESDTLLSTARSKTEQITGDAQLKASTIESDARRHHTEAMNSLGAKRAAMLDEIDRLDQLARGYQAALNDHVAQQLQELNSAPDLPGSRELA